MFQSPYPIINFPLGLIKIDACNITGYEPIKHITDIFGTSSAVALSFAFTFLLIGEQMGDTASTYLRNLKIFLQNEMDRCLTKVCHLFHLSDSETHIFFCNGFFLLMLGSLIADLDLPE